MQKGGEKIETKDFISCLPYWDRLTDIEKKLVRQSSVVRNYKKGQVMNSLNNECLGMILLLDGEARSYILSEEGREVTLFRLYKGNACVLSASCVIDKITFDTQIAAETDCCVLIVAPGVFAALAEKNIHVRCFAYELATEHFSSAMTSMQQILFMRYSKRLAMFLVKEYDRTNNPKLSMTHERIAQNTSSAREVVARTLKRFAADGFVELRRGTILLKDIDGLKKIS